MFNIEKNVAITKLKSGGSNKTPLRVEIEETLEAINIGESFVVPKDKYHLDDKRFSAYLTTIMITLEQRYKNIQGVTIKFVSRAVPEGRRVWRVK